MRIVISLEVDDEYADPDDDTGVTETGFNLIFDRLRGVGDDIEIRQADTDG